MDLWPGLFFPGIFVRDPDSCQGEDSHLFVPEIVLAHAQGLRSKQRYKQLERIYLGNRPEVYLDPRGPVLEETIFYGLIS